MVSYDDRLKRFIVEYKMPGQGQKVQKQAGRLGLVFDFDDEVDLKRRLNNA